MAPRHRAVGSPVCGGDVMHTRLTLRVAFALSVSVALAACSDSTTSPLPPERPAPQQPLRSISVSSSAVPRVVVVFRDTTAIPASGLSLIAGLGGTVAERRDDIGIAFVDGLSLATLAQLRASSLVYDATFDRLLHWLPGVRALGAVAADAVAVPHGDPTQTRYYADGTQWNMRVIKADKAWGAGSFGNASTRVAIVDTGIDYGNRELVGLVDLAASKSFSSVIVDEAGNTVVVPNEPQLPGDSAFMDNHFHGTHVASTVA